MVKEDPNKRTVKVNEVCITRVFNAPANVVFNAWSDMKLLERWFAPKECSIRYKYMEFKEGGKFLSCVYNSSFECWCIGEYLEILKNKRIVYRIENADENGNVIDPTSIGMDPEWPFKSIVYVDFAEENGKTVVTLEQSVDETLAKKTGAYPSWIQMLDNLETKLKTI